jgi:hypothetical protein
VHGVQKLAPSMEVPSFCAPPGGVGDVREVARQGRGQGVGQVEAGAVAGVGGLGRQRRGAVEGRVRLRFEQPPQRRVGVGEGVARLQGGLVGGDGDRLAEGFAEDVAPGIK